MVTHDGLPNELGERVDRTPVTAGQSRGVGRAHERRGSPCASQRVELRVELFRNGFEVEDLTAQHSQREFRRGLDRVTAGRRT